MGKENDLIRRFTVTLTVTLAAILTVFLCSIAVVKAEEGTTEETEEAVEKELVQCSNDWTILRYLDDSGISMFDIKYMDKTKDELEPCKLAFQFRSIYQDSITSEITTSSWRITDDIVSEVTKDDIKNYKENYFIQFRVLDVDDTYTPISMSDIFPIYSEEHLSPYIMSADYGIPGYCDYYNYYDLRGDSNTFKVTLKFSEQLKQIATPSVSILARDGSVDSHLLDYSATNLSFENKCEEYTVDEKKYKLEYSLVSFDVNLSPLFYDKYAENNIGVNYTLSFTNLEGINSSNNLPSFILKTDTPPTNSPLHEPVYVQSIKITASSSIVKPGNTIVLTAKVFPGNAANTSVRWYSSNPDYATVDENGVVTAKTAGSGKSVVVTAKANDKSGVKSSITIQIQPIASKAIPVSSIKLSADKTTIPAGGKVTVKAKVAPGNATNKAVTWKSSNTRYATVNTKGVVTTKAAGAGKTVTITATAKDQSGKKASIKIKIARVKVSSIKLSAGSKTVKAGKKITVKAKVSPSNATTKAVTWKSSNKKYATVSSKGVVTAKKAGKGKTVTITAEARDGSGKKGRIKIKIK